MIGHNLESPNLYIKFIGFSPYQASEIFCNIIYQYSLTVLGTPNKMIVDIINATSRYFISFFSPLAIYIIIIYP